MDIDALKEQLVSRQNRTQPSRTKVIPMHLAVIMAATLAAVLAGG